MSTTKHRRLVDDRPKGLVRQAAMIVFDKAKERLARKTLTIVK